MNGLSGGVGQIPSLDLRVVPGRGIQERDLLRRAAEADVLPGLHDHRDPHFVGVFIRRVLIREFDLERRSHGYPPFEKCRRTLLESVIPWLTLANRRLRQKRVYNPRALLSCGP